MTTFAEKIQLAHRKVSEPIINVTELVGEMFARTINTLEHPQKDAVYWYCHDTKLAVAINELRLCHKDGLTFCFNHQSPNHASIVDCGSGDAPLYLPPDREIYKLLHERFKSYGFELLEIVYNDTHSSDSKEIVIYLQVGGN